MRVARILGVLGALAVTTTIAVNPVAAGVAGITIGFETFPNGSPIPPNTVVTDQFTAVVFPEGMEVVECSPAAPGRCAAAHGGKRAARPLPGDSEFAYDPVVITFPRPVARVTGFVLIAPGQSGPAILDGRVFDQRGNLRYGWSTETDAGVWRPFEARHPDGIGAIELRGGALGTRTSNALVIDDLTIELPEPPSGSPAPTPIPTPPTPVPSAPGPPAGIGLGPVVTISDPVAEAEMSLDRLPVEFEARGRTDVVARVSYDVEHESGPVYTDVGYCGVGFARGRCGPSPVRGAIAPQVTDPRAGRYTVTIRAVDAAGRVATAAATFRYVPPDAPAPVDLRVLGVEYSQGFQDVVYTDLRSHGLVGDVPASNYPGLPSSRLSLPVVPGKPMVVRIYVTAGPQPEPPTNGVLVTGRLTVWDGVTGHASWGFRPLNSTDCQDHLGRGTAAGQACSEQIRVFETLGSAGLPIGDFDLDLLAARSHWGGTLNFVVPGNVTELAAASRSLNLAVEVTPVTAREVHPADNRFRLALPNIAEPATLNLRIVRVGMQGLPAPTPATARRTLDDMARMLLPYARINAVSDQAFAYGGTTESISGWIDFDDCQTLWRQLYTQFGLDYDDTLLALLPSGVTLTGCSGLGWRVGWPDRDDPDYLGGIAFAPVPSYPADGARSTAANWDEIGTVAQETYHAHLDRRHVGNHHGEDGGCALTGALATIVDIASFDTLDTDCHKPAPFPHGAIGAYPGPVTVGTPGTTSLGHYTNRLTGVAGGMGIRIEDGGRLTLYDPCPTGSPWHPGPSRTRPEGIHLELPPVDVALPGATRVPLDDGFVADARRSRIRSWLADRFDTTTGESRCTLADGSDGSGLVAHDFMSYGANPWYSTGLVPVLPDTSQLGVRSPEPVAGADPHSHDEADPHSHDEADADSHAEPDGPGHDEAAAAPDHDDAAAPAKQEPKHPPIRIQRRPGWLITGFVDQDGTVSFGPLAASGQASFRTGADHTGGLVLRVRTRGGETLTVTPQLAQSDGHVAPSLFFAAAVPIDRVPAEVTLATKDGQTLGTQRTTGRPPVLGTPTLAVDRASGGTSIRWTVDHPRSDRLSYAVDVSTDAGETWQPFGVTHGVAELGFDPTAVRSGNAVCIRVTAAAGLDAAIATTAKPVTRSGGAAGGSCTDPFLPTGRSSAGWFGFAAAIGAGLGLLLFREKLSRLGLVRSLAGERGTFSRW